MVRVETESPEDADRKGELEREKTEEDEEVAESPAVSSPPPSGPGGLVVFGQLVQKHSYVSALIIMMVIYPNSSICIFHPLSRLNLC